MGGSVIAGIADAEESQPEASQPEASQAVADEPESEPRAKLRISLKSEISKPRSS